MLNTNLLVKKTLEGFCSEVVFAYGEIMKKNTRDTGLLISAHDHYALHMRPCPPVPRDARVLLIERPIRTVATVTLST